MFLSLAKTGILYIFKDFNLRSGLLFNDIVWQEYSP